MSQPKAINLQDLPQAKLKDLLEFPCHFTFKVVGANREDLVDDVVVVTQKYAKGDYNPRQQKAQKVPIIPFRLILWRKILSK